MKNVKPFFSPSKVHWSAFFKVFRTIVVQNLLKKTNECLAKSLGELLGLYSSTAQAGPMGKLKHRVLLSRLQLL